MGRNQTIWKSIVDNILVEGRFRQEDEDTVKDILGRMNLEKLVSWTPEQAVKEVRGELEALWWDEIIRR